MVNLSTWGKRPKKADFSTSGSRKPPLTAHEVNPDPLRLNEKGGHQREAQLLNLCCVQKKLKAVPSQARWLQGRIVTAELAKM